MNLSVQIAEDGRPQILVEGKPWIWGVGLNISIKGTWHHDGEELFGGTWARSSGEDAWGRYHSWERVYDLGGESLLRLVIREYDAHILVRAELLRDVVDLSRADSFNEATFLAPTFQFSEEVGFFCATFGLGSAEDKYPGGYWPEAFLGQGPKELPQEAFVPLVLFSSEGALAIAPANYFLTSVLVRIPGGAARGLCGAVDRLPAGTYLETVIARGKDLPEALMHLGDLLLARGSKSRPRPSDHPLLSTLGYWNAYGSYYAELFRPMDAKTLEALADYFRKEGIPIRYFGLDLWYPYHEIGQALQYVPDRKKYPRGLAEITERTGLPYVLHLSALAGENTYGADGADPEVYRKIARELKEQQGIAAWHDWLRTQQHLTPRLRSDPKAAERWFSGMAEAFAEQGLPVLLCMQTMGMILASTALPNVLAARSYTDYIFGQPQQIEKLLAMGLANFAKDKKSRQVFIKNNVIMGMVLYAFGLSPFHDLFITNANHCEGFGDELAEQEALLRALSCGPVGIGDKLGQIDKGIIARLAFPDGRLAQPDRPLFPLQETLGEGILVAWTETRLSEKLRWIYLVVFNVGEEERSYRVDTSRIFGNAHFIYDYFGGQLVKKVEGRLPPARAHYYVLVPEVIGIGLLGLTDKFVTMPSGRLLDFQVDKREIQATFSLPQGVVYPVAAFSPNTGLAVAADERAEVVKVQRGDLVIAWIKPAQEVFSLRFSERTWAKRR